MRRAPVKKGGSYDESEAERNLEAKPHVLVPAAHDLDAKESITRDALAHMQRRHRHCGLPS